MPAYNAERYLAEAITSVLAQTYQYFELIVVDDGSTDSTPLIIQQFADRIRCIRQPNQGLSAARNIAIRNARSDLIALLDADDLWKPTYLERMLNHLNQQPQAAAVYCGFHYIDSNGDNVGRPSLKVVAPALFYGALIASGNWLVPSAVIFRKKLAEDAGLFDESLGAVEDSDLWIKMAAVHPFTGLAEALVKYRRHENNMSKDPKRMINASYQQTVKMFGVPQGNVQSWPRLKRYAYEQFFRSGSIRYLAHGDVEMSARYFQQLVEISPGSGISMALWRGLIRAHLPEELNNPSTQPNWESAQHDIVALLNALALQAQKFDMLQKHYARFRASAFLAMADEAGRANKLRTAYRWLWAATSCNPPLLFSRAYWGTIARSIRYTIIPTSSQIGER
jgi:glycosyltransferase involved in cell wall biosynthesis